MAPQTDFILSEKGPHRSGSTLGYCGTRFGTAGNPVKSRISSALPFFRLLQLVYFAARLVGIRSQFAKLSTNPSDFPFFDVPDEQAIVHQACSAASPHSGFSWSNNRQPEIRAR
jgi:hypothetical protein